MFGNRFRYVVAALILGSTLTIYVGRINLSTAIVAMAKKQTNINDHHATLSDVCSVDQKQSEPSQHVNQTTPTDTSGEFDWDEKTQGVILGAFFYGYFALQVAGGRSAEIFGPRLLCFIGVFGTGVINLATPLLARSYYAVFIGSRVVLGAIQALVFPSCYALASRWTPDHERSTVLSLTSIGGSIGSIITSSMTGFLSKHGFAGGWPSVFYMSGIICVAYSLIYFLLVTNDPEQHRFVTTTEQNYISSNIDSNKGKNAKNKSFPWAKVFTCKAVYAAIFVKITMTWFYTVLLLKTPAYMEKVLQMPLEQNGYFSSVIYTAMGLSHFVGGLVADTIIKKQYFSKTVVRKLFESVATFGSALFLALIPLSGCNKTWFLVLMVASMLTFGMQAGGELPLAADLTNEFTASLFGIANMLAMINGFVCPYIIGAMLDSDPMNPKKQWAYVFYLSSGLNVLGGLVFDLFGSAERQDWDRVEDVDESNNNNNIEYNSQAKQTSIEDRF